MHNSAFYHLIMINSEQILATVNMLQKENLDVRAVTLGLDLLDCRAATVHEYEGMLLVYARAL